MKTTVLDKIADMYVPNKRHKYLHVNAKDAWISVISDLISYRFIYPNKTNIVLLAKNWELLLFKHYSQLN